MTRSNLITSSDPLLGRTIRRHSFLFKQTFNHPHLQDVRQRLFRRPRSEGLHTVAHHSGDHRCCCARSFLLSSVSYKRLWLSVHLRGKSHDCTMLYPLTFSSLEPLRSLPASQLEFSSPTGSSPTASRTRSFITTGRSSRLNSLSGSSGLPPSHSMPPSSLPHSARWETTTLLRTLPALARTLIAMPVTVFRRSVVSSSDMHPQTPCPLRFIQR